MNRRGFLWSLGIGAGTLVAAPALSLVPDPAIHFPMPLGDMAEVNAVLKAIYLPAVMKMMERNPVLYAVLAKEER